MAKKFMYVCLGILALSAVSYTCVTAWLGEPIWHEPDGPLEVPVFVGNADDLRAILFYIIYDSDIWTLAEIYPSGEGAGWMMGYEVNGDTLVVAMATSTGIYGDVEIATVMFDLDLLESPGTDSTTFEVVLPATDECEEFRAEIVVIIPCCGPSPTAPTTWGAIKSMHR